MFVKFSCASIDESYMMNTMLEAIYNRSISFLTSSISQATDRQDVS
jgi:hypothetical protein